MTSRFPIVTLREAVTFQRGLTYTKSDEVDSSENVVLRANNIDLGTGKLNLSELRYIKDSVEVPASKKVSKDSLLICTASGSKSHLGKVALIDKDYGFAFGGFMGQVTPTRQLDSKYLFYALTSEDYRDFIHSLTDGANINNLKFDALGDFSFPVPPIEEQKRIVAILDEAFAAIDKAKANSEKNIQNARELFDSYLNNIFSNPAPDWEEKGFDEFCEISSMLVDPRLSEYQDLTHVGAANIETKTGELSNLKTAKEENLISGKFWFDRSMVLYSKIRPYLMKVARPNFNGLCSSDIYPLAPKNGSVNRDFLFYLLLSPDFTEYAVSGSARAGMPKVNREHLFAYRCQLPPMSVQYEIANRFHEILSESRGLESAYREKREQLGEVRKSLLRKAFSGELTAARSNVIAFPRRFAGITPTDLHAGIIATAYRMHEKKAKLINFHHVKAEKIVHMAEAFLGFDLERNPTKMAAGPNDFPRMHKVEHRAKMANFFHVEKQNNVYSYRPGKKFDEIIAKTRDVLGENYAELESLIDKMVPMDTRQAEILATTFAAWNNLQMDSVDPTDDQIVLEARDNWHQEKLRIPRDRFLKAIGWMRNNEIVPSGLGKKIE